MSTRFPGSKSITNRALLLAAAARGRSRLYAPLRSDDTLAFRSALAELGVRVTEHSKRAVVGGQTGATEYWEVTGLGGGPSGDADIWCADAGTAARFLTPFAAAGTGRFTFDGSPQLRARPLAPLAAALARLGAEVDPGPDGTLPLTVRANGLGGGGIDLAAGQSSQYLTGLLLAGPLMRTPLTVRTEGLVSRPYVDMTLALMRRFGVDAEVEGGVYTVRPGAYTGTDLVIEPDASTASYFLAAAAVTGTSVTVPGLGESSLQGDLRFADVLRRTGARVRIGRDSTTVTGTGPLRGGFTVDMGEISDTFMTLAAIAPLADAPITIRGIGHARLKESDRIAAVAENLGAIGITADTGPDWITVHPGRPGGARISCRRDHRIAMAFSVLGLRVPGIALDDPACVVKTFPDFHAEFRRVFPEHSRTLQDAA